MKKLIDFVKSLRSEKIFEYTVTEIPLSNSWSEFDGGKSLGKKGSENGVTVFDKENKNGARITLESQCGTTPFAVTFGIYGLMFHTAFFNEESKSVNYIKNTAEKIELVFEHYEIEESQQGEEWIKTRNKLIENLID